MFTLNVCQVTIAYILDVARVTIPKVTFPSILSAMIQIGKRFDFYIPDHTVFHQFQMSKYSILRDVAGMGLMGSTEPINFQRRDLEPINF